MNKNCLSCGVAFKARKGAKTCSDKCRKALQRRRQLISYKAGGGASEAHHGSLFDNSEFAGQFPGPGAESEDVARAMQSQNVSTESNQYLQAYYPQAANRAQSSPPQPVQQNQAQPQQTQVAEEEPEHSFKRRLVLIPLLVFFSLSLWSVLGAVNRAKFEPQASFGERWLNTISLNPIEVEGPVGPAGLAGEAGKDGKDGKRGAAGADDRIGLDGADGASGADGATGPQGPQGPSGTANCPNGDCVSLQAATPGVQETGHVNISGNIISAGHSAFGPSASINQPLTIVDGLGTFPTQAIINVGQSFSDYSAGIGSGFNSRIIANPSTANTQTIGHITWAGSANTNTQAITNLAGTYSYAEHQGTGNAAGVTGVAGFVTNTNIGTIGTAVATEGRAVNFGSGAITNAIALQGSVSAATGSAINNGYGLKIRSSTNSGTFLNNYGVYIEDQSAVGSTNSYNLYSAGANAKNYIQGTLGIGAPTPGAKLHITTAGASTIGQIIQGATGQTADLLQLQNSAGTILTTFDKDGKLVFGPSGAQDTNLYRAAANTLKTDDGFVVGTLGSSGTVALCSNAGQISTCNTGVGAATLQSAYDLGNTITTTDGRNILFTLADTATDANLNISIADGSTSTVSITRADGVGVADPAQLLLLDNLDLNRSVPVGLKIQAAAGGISVGVDASDADINTALYAGANFIRMDQMLLWEDTPGTFLILDISGNPLVAVVDDGSTGTTTFFGATSDLSINGGDISGTNIAVNAAGSLNLSSGVGSNIILNSGNTIELQDAVNVTGILSVSSLGSGGTTALCRNFATEISTCSANANGVTLQQAYDAGNSIFTTTAKDIYINLANTTTDPRFFVNIESGSDGYFGIRTNDVNTFTVSSSGAALFKNFSNSTTAFQVQPAASTTPVFNVDTTNSRVGIGTATPTEDLHIQAADAGLLLQSTGATNRAVITLNAVASNYTNLYLQDGGTTKWEVGKTDANHFYIWDSTRARESLNINGSNGEFAIQPAGGNVGIGTYSPGARLDVDTDPGDNVTALLVRQQDTTNNPTAFEIQNTTTGNSFVIDTDEVVISSTGAATFKNSTNSTTAFQIQTAAGTNVFSASTASSALSSVNFGDVTRSLKVVGKYLYVNSNATASPGEFHIIDVSNPSSPVEVGNTDLDDHGRGLDVAGKYAYAGSQSTGDDLQIIDISNPKAPTVVGGLNLDDGVEGFNGVKVAGNYAYVTSGTTGNEFHVIDVSNPAAPAEVGNLALPDAGQGIYVQGRYAYVTTSATGDDFHVIDISNPAAPTVTDSLNLPDAANSVYVVGRYAYVTINSAGNELRVIDVSDPAIITETTSLDLANSARGIVVANNMAYIALASSTEDLTIVDVSDPTSPNKVETANLADQGFGIDVAGKNVFVALNNSTMQIVDIPSVTISTANVGSIHGGSANFSNDIQIGNNLNIQNSLNVGSGGIFSEGRIATETDLVVGTNIIVKNGYVQLPEITAPGTPAANNIALYVLDHNGVSTLFYKGDDGVEVGPLGRFAGCRLERAANQTGFGTGGVSISFDTEKYDTDAFCNLVANPTRITIQRTGYYRISAGYLIELSTINANAEYVLYIIRNGTTALAADDRTNGGATARYMSVRADAVQFFTAGDYIEAQALSNQDTSWTIYGDINPWTFLEAAYIAR